MIPLDRPAPSRVHPWRCVWPCGVSGNATRHPTSGRSKITSPRENPTKAYILQSISLQARSAHRLPGFPGNICLSATRRILCQETLTMKKTEWTREILTTWPSYEYVKQEESAGWRLAAVEWQREADVSPQSVPPEGSHFGEEIPYGTRIAGDCLHLEENPLEMEVLNCLAEMIVQDLSYARMAEALNHREFHTRDGKPWSSLAVFKLTPRLIA